LLLDTTERRNNLAKCNQFPQFLACIKRMSNVAQTGQTTQAHFAGDEVWCVHGQGLERGQGPHPGPGVKTMSTFVFNVPTTLPVYIAKIGLTREVKIEKAVLALLANGLKQKVNDDHSQITKKDWKGTDAEFVAAVTKEVDKTIATIESGGWKVPVQIVVAPTDEALAEMLGISVDDVKAMKAAKLAGKPATESPKAPESTLIKGKKAA
jgi:hypothetical protein